MSFDIFIKKKKKTGKPIPQITMSTVRTVLLILFKDLEKRKKIGN